MNNTAVLVIIALAILIYSLEGSKEKSLPAPDGGGEGGDVSNFCSSPQSMIWNPLAPPNSSTQQMLGYCGAGTSMVSTNMADHGSSEKQLHLCYRPEEGDIIVRYNQPWISRADTLSMCSFGEHFITGLTMNSFLVAPAGTFGDGPNSASNYVVHEHVDAQDNQGAAGPIDVGSVVSILKPKNGTILPISWLIDYIWLPRQVKWPAGTYDRRYNHFTREELVQRLQEVQQGDLSNTRRVGDPSMPHAIDLDLDISGVTPDLESVNFPMQDFNSALQQERRVLSTLMFFHAEDVAKEDFPEKAHRIFDILDIDKDGIIGDKEREFWARFIQPYDNEIAQFSSEDDRLQGYGSQYYNVLEGVGSPAVQVIADYPSMEWIDVIYNQSSLELCYNSRRPNLAYDADGEPFVTNAGCDHLYGVSHIDGMPIKGQFSTYFGFNGIACGNDTQTLCFTLEDAFMEAKVSDYEENVKWQVDSEATGGGYIYKRQIGTSTLADPSTWGVSGGTTYSGIDWKNDLQCPASHPNFKRFCLDYRTSPELRRTLHTTT